MKEIKLSIYKKNPKHKGMVALVSDEDYERVSKYYWTATEARPGLFYASRSTPRDENGKQKVVYMHNYIMGRNWIDHKDRNGLNNTRENLRHSCQTTNSRNRKHRKSKSGFCGVEKNNNGTFRARIKVDGKFKTIGNGTALECAKMYNDAALLLYGEFASLNVIT